MFQMKRVITCERHSNRRQIQQIYANTHYCIQRWFTQTLNIYNSAATEPILLPVKTAMHGESNTNNDNLEQHLVKVPGGQNTIWLQKSPNTVERIQSYDYRNHLIQWKGFNHMSTDVHQYSGTDSITWLQKSPNTVGIRSIRSQGRPAPSFCRTTRSHYKPHELCKTSDYSICMYYYHMYHLCYSSCSIPSMILPILCTPFFLKCAYLWLVVVTIYLYAFSWIRCRNQIRVNIKLFVTAHLILIWSLQLYRDWKGRHKMHLINKLNNNLININNNI